VKVEKYSPTDRIVDEYLILRCQDGDTTALPVLIERWQQPFQRFAMIVTKDQDLAADVVQDSWIKIIKGLPRLRDPVSFQAWAYRIVNNRCMDVLKKRYRYQEIATIPSVKTNPIGALEERDYIQSLLAQLSDKHRSVLALHYLLGFDVGEIARITKSPRGTVKSRLFKAREKFRILLEGGEENRPGDAYEPVRQTNSGSLASSF
jgi:RNA polymerase sigma-70 factor (ECF subfamily)